MFKQMCSLIALRIAMAYTLNQCSSVLFKRTRSIRNFI